MLEITPEFVKSYFYDVVRLTAKNLGIQDWEWKSTKELMDEIANYPKTYAALNYFFTCYGNWEKTVTMGNVTADDVIKKDNSRNDLVAVSKTHL